MAAKIVNLADTDEDKTLCATVEEAEQTLAEMIERLQSQGYRIEIRHDSGDDHPQNAVYDLSDAWIGMYTIELQ